MRAALVATLAVALAGPTAGCNAILGVEPGHLRADGGRDAGPKKHDAVADAPIVDASAADSPAADARDDAPAPLDGAGPDAAGPGGVGAPCDTASECQTGVCLDEATSAFPGGYCAGSCTDCKPGSHCTEVVGTDLDMAFCLRDCESDADCERAGSYSCFDLDGDGTIECAAVATGTGGVGAPCNTVADCGGDPPYTCIPQSSGWLGGYCTRPCTATIECPAGTECASNSSWAHSVCLKSCAISGDCRTTYECIQGTCQPP